MFLWRPVLADPPLCTRAELRTVLNLDDLFDMNEALDLREHLAAKAQRDAEKR